MDIEDFILARARAFNDATIYAMVYTVVQLHKQWPVLVEEPFDFKIAHSTKEGVSYQTLAKMAWMSRESYARLFGGKAPTSPILIEWANIFSNHADFQEEWRK